MLKLEQKSWVSFLSMSNEGDYQWLCGDKVNFAHTQRFVLPGNEYSISSDYCLTIMSNRD
jgi:hypothetical protein